MRLRRRALSARPEVALPWGEILYRASLILAAFVLVFAIFNSLYQISIGLPMIPLAPLVIAVSIWLVGLFCRQVSMW
jgi:hypothetical protein